MIEDGESVRQPGMNKKRFFPTIIQNDFSQEVSKSNEQPLSHWSVIHGTSFTENLNY